MTFKVVTKKKMRGLGDAVAAVTNATGIAHIAHAAAELLGVDCRCDQRQSWLNYNVPFKDNGEALTPDTKPII